MDTNSTAEASVEAAIEPAPATIPAPTPSAPTARIVSGPARVQEIELGWPVEHEGKLWTAIPIRRLTARQVADYIEAVRANPKDAPDLPMVDAPQAVIDALDDDDAFAVEEATKAFLPHRFRGAPASV